MDFMFVVVPAIVIAGFVFVIGAMIVRGVQGAKQWKRNNDSPVLDVEARVVAKRTDVRVQHHHSMHGRGGGRVSQSTTYYITFELARSSRMELRVQDTDYGMIAEGDEGILTFQGTRFLGFGRR